MKKFGFILAVIMLFTLVSCGNNAENKVLACPSQSFLKNVGESAENPPENDKKSDETEDENNAEISEKEDDSNTPITPESTSKNENKGQNGSDKGISAPSKPSGAAPRLPKHRHLTAAITKIPKSATQKQQRRLLRDIRVMFYVKIAAKLL